MARKIALHIHKQKIFQFVKISRGSVLINVKYLYINEPSHSCAFARDSIERKAQYAQKMKIESTSQLASIIRSQIDSMRKASKAAHSGTHGVKKDLVKAKKVSPEKKTDVGSLIVQRIAGIPLEDPHRRRKVFRAFLESVLLDDLGERLIADPRFFQMVEDIQHQMQADPELAPVIEQAIDLLLSPAS